MRREKEYFQGCLIGGALGDALGWPVELMKRQEIIQEYGEEGIQKLVPGEGGKAEVSDDTQMTLFTAEGLLRAEAQGRERGVTSPPDLVYYAYLRWLHTQGYPKVEGKEWVYDGWLMQEKGLFARRAPGKTCLSALLSGRQGSVGEPLNDSKGCGGVMRVAPVGLMAPQGSFQLGCQCAALTHGHPGGYLPAGALAHIISRIISGFDLDEAIIDVLPELKGYPGGEEMYRLILKAIELAQGPGNPEEAIGQLGQGWVGEEALAIAVYCTLKEREFFEEALRIAVNHDGDSDSTGSITGNILGAYLGIKEIPGDWVEKLELSRVISQVADDLFQKYEDTPRWRERYPGY